MAYLLDTNFCVQYLRGRNLLVRQRLAAKPLQDIRLCSVVKSELYLGALRSARPAENRSKVDGFVAPYLSCPFDDAAADTHARIRHQTAADDELEELLPIGGGVLIAENAEEHPAQQPAEAAENSVKVNARQQGHAVMLSVEARSPFSRIYWF